ncbi:allophanate hydrolase [Pseudomaricurvus alcaniphilus]|uniref:allophanate hydrolase n=1 Tax=Pseudomaricurvus alcaniphilus TaxID=1166482 RepID=UPI001407C980|nr:allophanate hydrolase [Pseudomaricurvus alcaniphilus]NHN39336.1 allophanate hydrolase [Pseudomaricurvus alcaniphilus]
MELQNLTIDYLKSQYQAGTFTPQELVDHLLHKTQTYSDKNLFIQMLPLDEIKNYIGNLDPAEIDSKPLWGIPFVIKDNIDLAGIATTAACEAFSYVPSKSAFVVQQLINAGAIPLAKTNMDQFATGLVGTRSPDKWGPCRNSFNNNFVSGGSSSGSAVAVALGLASFSLGTDTAGSGRVPAAFNNLIGLKPSRGLLSCTGVVPACKSLDCVSIFATTTDDASQVFEVAAQFDPEDCYSRKNPATNFNNYGAAKQPFRFAIPQEQQLEFFGNIAASNLFDAAVAQLEALGGVKVEIDFSPLFDAAKLLYSGPWVTERYVATEEIYTEQPEAMLPVIREIIGKGVGLTAADTFKALYQLQAYKQQADLLFAEVDILVTPTAGTIYTQGEMADNPIGLNSNLGYYTNFMNLLDYSAIAVPAGFFENGLPFGITLAGKAFDDSKLLSMANHWQTSNQYPLGATDWPLPALRESAPGVMDSVDVVVCGAHLEGLALNWQLLDRDAKLLERTSTAANYRLYALAGGPPYRPGLVRDSNNGSAIEVEVWRLPTSQFGSFVAGIPQPLGIGKVELTDGRWVAGFICEPCATDNADEITHLGGWRNYLAQQQ